MDNWLSKKHQSYFIRHFWVVSLSFIILSSLGFFVGIRLVINEQMILLKSSQERKIIGERNLMEHLLDEAVLDLSTMSESQLFGMFFTGEVDNVNFQHSFDELLKNLFNQKNNYYQLRHLNLDGMEVFRVERRNGEPYICLGNELQDKSDRYYFQEAIKLKAGEFYVSPFDLNIEHGEVEKPYRPMLRICIPVFDSAGNKLGINVLNYDGTNLIKELDNQSLSDLGFSYLVNSEGYFLNAPDSSLEWGFVFSDKKAITIETFFPEDSEQIKEMTYGQFQSPHGLYSISVVDPFKKIGEKEISLTYMSDYQWKVMSFIPGSEMDMINFLPVKNLVWLFIFVLLVGFVFAFFYSNIATRKYQAQLALVESEQKLKVSNQTKDRFFSIVSHDLKNASGTIANYLEFMTEGYADFSEDERTVHLKDITFAASQHNKLLYEILDWARLQMGKVELKPMKVSVEELFNEQVKLVELPLKNKGINMEVIVDKDLQVFGDKEMLKTIFRNLINNAIKFSFRDSRILLSGKEKSEKVELKVVDFGIGMRESDATKIFDLSSKIQQPGTENEAGTGFGLKLVAELVEKNNGSIRVESDLGKGSSFIISLPSGK